MSLVAGAGRLLRGSWRAFHQRPGIPPGRDRRTDSGRRREPIGRDYLFRGRDAVGQEMPVAIPGSGGKRARVVGVIEDVRYTGLAGPGGGSGGTSRGISSRFGEPVSRRAHGRRRGRRCGPGTGRRASAGSGKPIAQVRSLEETVRLPLPTGGCMRSSSRSPSRIPSDSPSPSSVSSRRSPAAR